MGIPKRLRLLLIIVYYYSTFNGLFAVYYDTRARKLIQSKWLQIYTYSHNAMMILGLPIMLSAGLRHNKIYDTNPIAKYSNNAVVILDLAVILVTVLHRPWREKRILHVVHKLQSLQSFISLPLIQQEQRFQSIHPQLNYLLASKISSSFLHIMLLGLSNLPMIFGDNWRGKFHVFYLFNMITLQQGSVFHFYLLLWYCGTVFNALNCRFQRVLQTASHSVTTINLTALQALHTICMAHHELLNAVSYVNETYCIVLISTFFAYFLNIIVIGYFLVLILTGVYTSIPTLNIWTGVVLHVLLIYDFYFLNYLVEIASQLPRDTIKILRNNSLLAHLPLTLTRYCDWLIMHLTWRHVHVNVFGWFYINRRLTFRFLAEIALYTIIFVQNDYRNIWH